MSSKPIAVIIGDIHFTPQTLDLACNALKQAQAKATALSVPLILNGDTFDTKALVRAECMNALIEILDADGVPAPEYYVSVGNHDRINEKSEEHSLNFLKPYCNVINTPTFVHRINSYIVPYQHDTSVLSKFLGSLMSGSRLIMHQGVQSAKMGHYSVDNTSLPKSAYSDFRVISSHYHARQDIKAGRPQRNAVGLFSYIGNPYTLSFGEAYDPSKGFAILHENGTLTHVDTNLRKHVVLEKTVQELDMSISDIAADDLVLLRIKGTASELSVLDKAKIGKTLFGRTDYKLELVPLNNPNNEALPENLTDEQILDTLIDQSSESPNQKQVLKSLWREVMTDETLKS